MEMLDHQKMVLQNVSNDENLFRKELLKSLHWLSSPERNQLYLWLKANFGDNYQSLISEVYLKSA